MTNATTRAVTINIPNAIRLTPEKREALDFDLTKLPESVIGDIFVGGFRVIMTNTYNAGGKDTPEADRRSNALRRFAAWLRGEYALTNTGPRESVIGEMREAFIAKQVSLGKTVKEAEESIRRTVTGVFGKDEKATFSRFLDAVATLKAKVEGAEPYDVIRESVEADAMAAVEAQRKAKAEVEEAELDLSDLF
jgi:hypothetical protein